MMYQPIKASRAVRQELYSLFAAGGPNIRENNPSRERCTYSKLNPPQSDEVSVTSPKKCNYATRSTRTVLHGDAASRRRRY
jgi:hypothetical protein